MFGSLELGILILFVIWCLEFVKYKESVLLRYSIQLFYYISGAQHYQNHGKAAHGNLLKKTSKKIEEDDICFLYDQVRRRSLAELKI